MSVIGHWRRSALGASGVALLLPLALAVGVGLTAALGGQTSLRALGQIFGGPATPPQLSAPELGDARAVPSVPNRRPAAGGPAATTPDGSSGSTPGGTTPATPEPATPTAPESRPDPAPPSQPGPAAPGAEPAPTPAPQPEPAPSGSVVHETGQAVTDVVAELPPPAGSAAGDAMQTVVDLIP